MQEYKLCCRFFCFYIILFLVHQTAAAMFRVIAALTRNLVLATSLGSLFLVIYLMLSGFIQAQRESSSENHIAAVLHPSLCHCHRTCVVHMCTPSRPTVMRVVCMRLLHSGSGNAVLDKAHHCHPTFCRAS